MIYQIEKLGFIPNANGWGENRSMTPVDLNSTIYGMEMDLAYFERELGISNGEKWAAKDIAGRWLRTDAANFQNPDPATHRPFKYGDGKRYPGALYEKYTRTGKINDDEYPCSVMLGWTASAFLDALSVWRCQ